METRKPSWWVLYLIVPVMAGLLVIEHDLVLSLLGHELAQFGIVVIIFGLMALWVRANEREMVSPTTRDSTAEMSHLIAYEASEPGGTMIPEAPGYAVRAARARGVTWDTDIERNN